MTEMTMGQRIALRRKLKNMSQEALAERLEVSRQAISKWESDGAVPEVDKLIALGKIFGVSVGWLLGTEREGGTPLPGNSLTEEQITAVEQIVARTLPGPPKRRWWPGVLLTAALALLITLGVSCADRLEEKNAENLAAVESLRRENEILQDQMDSVQAKLNAVAEADRILKSMSSEAVLLDEGNVRIGFAFTPKVYQEDAEAYLSVRIPSWNAELIPCEWNGETYTAQADLPLMDGIRYSFLLVTDGMFREQSLMDPDFYYSIDTLSNPALNSIFHLDPDSEQFGLVYPNDGHRWLDPELETYSFRENLYSPRIFREKGRGYQEILLILTLNGEVLMKESILEDFLQHSGGHPISSKPFPVDVSVALPELKYGDKLRLYLSVTMADGLPSYTLLDEMFSWERPE